MSEPGNASQAELRTKLARIRLVALDVDGVLTDGRVVHGPTGETQIFDVQDGFGIDCLRKAGITVAWITGRGCEATRRRAAELSVAHLVMKAGDKAPLLAKLQESLSVGIDETLAMGDDLPDLRMATRAAVFVAPANARPEVRAHAAWVTEARGGRGAVRDVAELLLEARGLWQPTVRSYTTP